MNKDRIKEEERVKRIESYIRDNFYTSTIVELFNKRCEENNYTERCYDNGMLDDILTGYSPSKILRMAQQNDFRVDDTYFYITDGDDLLSFNFYDDENSPIDIEELAREIVRDYNAFDNKRIAEIIYEFEVEDAEEDN